MARHDQIAGLLESLHGLGSYALDAEGHRESTDSHPLSISMSNVRAQVSRSDGFSKTSSPIATFGPVEAVALLSDVPRFIKPSTPNPLFDDFDGTILAHLQNQSHHIRVGSTGNFHS